MSPNKSKDLLVRDALVGPHLETDVGSRKVAIWLGVFCFSMNKNKLILPIVIVFAAIITGGFIYVNNIEKQVVSHKTSYKDGSYYVSFLQIGGQSGKRIAQISAIPTNGGNGVVTLDPVNYVS